MVFAGLYPGRAERVRGLRDALESWLNDASFTSRPRCRALGFGFRCGFLGLLHMDIVQERLERASTTWTSSPRRRRSSTRSCCATAR